MRVLAVVLSALLLLIQAQLWFGKGGLPHRARLRAELAQAQTENEAAQARNTQLLAELRDLKEGQEMIEEKARMELGMVKADEIYVQIQH